MPDRTPATAASRIRVLIVDDSATTRVLLAQILGSDARISVAGTAADGEAAIRFVQRDKPDVVLMDIHMPRMDGFEATRLIMETHPLPVVICSATTQPDEVETAFRLMEAGAVACVAKPVGPGHPDFDDASRRLLQTVRLMSEVKVVRRWPRERSARRSPTMVATDAASYPAVGGSPIVGIGASTGGPPVLQQILASLPKGFPAPILIVQHIAPGFLPGLIEWLNRSSNLPVQIPVHRVHPVPGCAYVAPDGFHLAVSANGQMVLSAEDPENGLRPAVSHLFRSLATHCAGRAIGVLLTGMGRDGAIEMKLMKEQGSPTLAQDRDTSIVHGMPGAAIALDAASHVLPIDQIAPMLISLVARRTIASTTQP